MKKRIIAGCCAVIMVVSLIGCSGDKTTGNTEIDFSVAMNENEEPYVFPETETYTNYIKMDKSWGNVSSSNDGNTTATSNSEGQFQQEQSAADNSTAIGDPFIMRFNGKYYLYPSTAGNTDDQRGVRVFESDDLIHWTYKGFAAQGEGASYGWAPEVLYYNGTFYMVTSPGGEGHYVLSSDSPLGPFKLVTDNIGYNIDGSLYLDDDGQIYLLSAMAKGTTMVQLDSDTLKPTGGTSNPASILGGMWVEGAFLFRRSNILYLTYTGNDVRSESYRVGYSYLMGDDPTGDFNLPKDNILLLNATGNGYYGLGHSMNIVGPNLDSVYTSYHTLLSKNNPFVREMMIDQLVTNGSMLLANGPTYTEVALPKRPDYEMDSAQNGFISDEVTGEIYTIEYNATPKNGSIVEFIFAYENEKNYAAVRWDMSEETLALVQVTGKKVKELKNAEIPGMLAEKLHTIRVEKGADDILVYLDSMKKLEVSAKDIGAGNIGVKGEAEYSYIAFTNDAYGTSDFDSVKNVPSSFPAVHYLKGENRGFSIQNAVDVEDGIRQNEPENTRKSEENGVFSLILDTPNDWVKYAMNVAEESYYGLTGTITSESAGAKIQVIIDESEIYTFTVPETGDAEEEYVNVMLGQFPLTAGNHTMKIRLVKGGFEVQTFELEPTNPTKISYESAMDTMNTTGWTYFGNWKIVDGAHVITPVDSKMIYACVGDETMTDFTMEVDVAMLEEMSAFGGGIFFHVKEMCTYRKTNVDQCMQGYYLEIYNGMISLVRCNYDYEEVDFVNVDFVKDEYHTIKIGMENNHIRIYVDDMDEPVIDYYDSNAFLTGQVVLGSYGSKMAFKNFKIYN